MSRRPTFWHLHPVLSRAAYEYDSNQGGGGGLGSLLGGCGPRLIVGLIIAAVVLFQYFSLDTQKNNFTGRTQHLKLQPQEEIRMGLASAPQMTAQYGGLSSDASAREYVSRVGQKIVTSTDVRSTGYRFDFHLLADKKVVNAFALPGGQVFITEALFRMLTKEDQLAGVLGHEVGHVVGRHSSEQIANSALFSGLTTAFSVGVSGDNHGYDAAQLAQWANQLHSLKFSRGDETEADRLGVRFLMQAGYQPEAMIEVMEVLKKAAGSGRSMEILSTHPNPDNRIVVIKEEIERLRKGGS